MSKTEQNFIADSWCDGQSTIANINPSDLSDQIGNCAQAECAELDPALGAAQTEQKKCTASSRLVVQAAIHDEFADRLVAAASAMKVGHALADGTQIGPVVSAGQLAENLQWMETAKQEGGEVLCGGETVSRDHDGYYMTPAVIGGTRNDWRINREEMFAPIACIIKVGSYDEALDVVNDTDFGLTSGIITRSLARATHFRRNAQTGAVSYTHLTLPTKA